MTWEHLIIFALISIVLWSIGAYGAWKNKPIVALTSTAVGLVVFLISSGCGFH